eukprot:13823781-Ditylum_brightwellii.AAC.1
MEVSTIEHKLDGKFFQSATLSVSNLPPRHLLYRYQLMKRKDCKQYESEEIRSGYTHLWRKIPQGKGCSISCMDPIVAPKIEKGVFGLKADHAVKKLNEKAFVLRINEALYNFKKSVSPSIDDAQNLLDLFEKCYVAFSQPSDLHPHSVSKVTVTNYCLSQLVCEMINREIYGSHERDILLALVLSAIVG